MATLGVTIGIGDEHRRYADEAACRVRHHLGIETLVIDESSLPLSLDLQDFKKKIWTLKFRLFDIVPDRWDRVMYFDNDWRPVRDWDVDLTFRDRNAIYVALDFSYMDFIQQFERHYKLEPGSYFNAGWMIVPCSARPLLDEARQRYFTLPESYGDQCVLNQVLAGKVTYAPRAFNVLDLHEWPDPANVMAVHSAVGKWNYQVYKGEVPDRHWDVVKYHDVNEMILRNLDYSHDWSIGSDQLVEVYQNTRSFSGGTALDIGSLRGHSALALALAGLNVRSYDNSDTYSRHREGLISRQHLTVDFRLERFESEFEYHDKFGVVLHDAEHGEHTRPELEKLWKSKVTANGLLIVHDVNELNLQGLLDAIRPLEFFVSEDDRGRQMGYFRKI